MKKEAKLNISLGLAVVAAMELGGYEQKNIFFLNLKLIFFLINNNNSMEFIIKNTSSLNQNSSKPFFFTWWSCSYNIL